jgi:hypothetical protein
MKQPTKAELRNRIAELEGDINNFPPYAVTAINENQLKEALRKRSDKAIRPLLNKAMSDIEKWDLKVDYMLIPRQRYKRFSNLFKRKRKVWGCKIVPITGLRSVILLSNIRSE